MKEYRLFADILDYPTPTLTDRIDELLPLVTAVDGKAGQFLARFRGFVAETAPAELEELYTGTFDLQPLCYPYAGYQLFGEEYRRGMFMAQLREHYRVSGFAAGEELPDHLCVILRFLSGREAGEVEHELIVDCLVPALRKMAAGFAEATNPYRGVLQSLMLLFGKRSEADAAKEE